MAWNQERELSTKGIPEIGLCIPHTQDVNMYWVEKAFCPLRGQPLSWCNKTLFLSSGPPIDVAREDLVDRAMDRGMDYIFFLDSDVVPRTPSDINMALYMLWSLQTPVVSGLYRAKKKYGYYWACWMKVHKKGKGYQPLVDFTRNLFKADIAGLGCTLVHREVFETMKKPWFKWDKAGSYSEDFFFFRKCKRYGYDLWIRGDVRFDHIGEFMISGDLEPKVILATDYWKDEENE